MTPKSLLRHPQVVSARSELSSGGFQRILGDNTATRREVSRVLLCSGKIYFELDKRRLESGRDDVAILRLEQLYPLPDETLAQALSPYAAGTPVFWVQDEPANMGAWPFLRFGHGATLLGRYPFEGITRRAAASPATGSGASHRLEQERLLERAFS
jgi:2-oxoglutarate dehydrogenase E1 component